MALSKSALKRAIDSVPECHDVGVWVVRVCRAVEAEVRKQDTELMQAALDALTCTGESDDPGHRCGHCDDYVDRNGQVRAALRARLEGKPCA